MPNRVPLAQLQHANRVREAQNRERAILRSPRTGTTIRMLTERIMPYRQQINEELEGRFDMEEYRWKQAMTDHRK